MVENGLSAPESVLKEIDSIKKDKNSSFKMTLNLSLLKLKLQGKNTENLWKSEKQSSSIEQLKTLSAQIKKHYE